MSALCYVFSFILPRTEQGEKDDQKSSVRCPVSTHRARDLVNAVSLKSAQKRDSGKVNYPFLNGKGLPHHLSLVRGYVLRSKTQPGHLVQKLINWGSDLL
jgi:hypothetical protein